MKNIRLLINSATFIVLTSLMLVNPLSASIDKVEKSNLVFENVTLTETLSNISKIYGTNIILRSNGERDSEILINLNMFQATLEEALKEVIRKANVDSHSLVYSNDNKKIKLWVFGSKPRNHSQVFTSHESKELDRLDHSQHSGLTVEQFNQLDESDSANHQALTDEQFRQLDPHEQSLGSQKSLSLTQMSMLDEEHSDQSINTKLSAIQMQLLEPDSFRQ